MESLVHRRMRLARLNVKHPDMAIVIDGVEHLSAQITNLHDRLVLMCQVMEIESRLQDRIIDHLGIK